MVGSSSSNLPFAQTFASSAIAACTAEVRGSRNGSPRQLATLDMCPDRFRCPLKFFPLDKRRCPSHYCGFIIDASMCVAIRMYRAVSRLETALLFADSRTSHQPGEAHPNLQYRIRRSPYRPRLVPTTFRLPHYPSTRPRYCSRCRKPRRIPSTRVCSARV